MSEITTAIEKHGKRGTTGDSNKKTTSAADINRQIDAAYAAGLIKEEPIINEGKKKRGRPIKTPLDSSSNNIDPISPRVKKSTPFEAADNIKRNAFIVKLSMYKTYFYDLCGSMLEQVAPSECSLEELKVLAEACEQSIAIHGSVASAPHLIKETLKTFEKPLVSFGYSKPTSSRLSDLRYLKGYSQVIDRDPEIDYNVKRISITLSEYMPNNPYLALAKALLTTGMGYINEHKLVETVEKEEFGDL